MGILNLALQPGYANQFRSKAGGYIMQNHKRDNAYTVITRTLLWGAI